MPYYSVIGKNGEVGSVDEETKRWAIESGKRKEEDFTLEVEEVSFDSNVSKPEEYSEDDNNAMNKALNYKRKMSEDRVEKRKKDTSIGRDIEDIFLTRDVTEKPDADPLDVAGGLSSFPARLLGAVAQKGNVKDESTKLFKGQLQYVKDWAESREAQNVNADDMIQSLKDSLNTEKVSQSDKVNIEKQIKEIEKSKNSGALTTGIDVLNSIIFESLSDPTVIISAVKNVGKSGMKLIRDIAKTEPMELAKGAVSSKISKLQKLGIPNERVLNVINDLEGKTVKDKLKNLRLKNPLDVVDADGKYSSKYISDLVESIDKDALQKQLDELELSKISNIKTQEQIDKEAIGSAVSGKEIVDKFVNQGEYSGTGKNVPFNEAEKIRKSIEVPVEDQKDIIRELLVTSTGGETPDRNYDKLVDDIFKLTDIASREQYDNFLSKNRINKNLSESIMQVRKGNVYDINELKKEVGDILQTEGSLQSTSKVNAKNFKNKMSDIISRSEGIKSEEINKLLSEGGKQDKASKELYKIFDVDPSQSKIVGENVDYTRALKNLDNYLDTEAKNYANSGFDNNYGDMVKGGLYDEWKRIFGLDLKDEVTKRAQKLKVESVTQQKVNAVRSAISSLGKQLDNKSNLAEEAIKKYSNKFANSKIIKASSPEEIQAIYDNDFKKIERELLKYKNKNEISKDFNDIVSYYTGKEGGFDMETTKIKEFRDKYGDKVADLIPEAGILSYFEISPNGKVKNSKKLIDAFSNVNIAGGGNVAYVIRTLVDVINKVSSNINPFSSKLDDVLRDFKNIDRKTAKEINRISKNKESAKEAIEYMVSNNPVIAVDLLMDKYKFIEPLDFIDKVALTSIISSTGREYTNREKLAAKRILERIKRKENSSK